MKRMIYSAMAALVCFYAGCSEHKKMPVQADVNHLKMVDSIVAHDNFLGRAPFTEGERLVTEFLRKELESLGTEPLFDGDYFQTFKLNKITSRVVSQPVVRLKGGKVFRFAAPADMALSSQQTASEVSVKGSPMVFCGFGIHSPKDEWDDFKGADLVGKTMVVLINDPGLYGTDKTVFNGEAMSWPGRWVYKFEEAVRQGAAAVLIVHEPVGAAYGWNVPAHSSVSPKLTPQGDACCPVNGWITSDAARTLFAAKGLSLDSLYKQACQRDFKPIDLNMTFSVEIRNTVEENTTRNVGGIIRGSEHPEKVVVITAHWDHFGVGAASDVKDASGQIVGRDSIFNGAVDNGVAIAWALEIGRLIKNGPAPKVSVAILFPGCEEDGLLGSDYFVRHSPIPVSNMIACLNTDMNEPKGKMKDLTVVGYGYAAMLDSLLENQAIKQNRYVLPDPNAVQGLLFRGDQFPFLKAGVSAVWMYGCYDSAEHGRDWAHARWDDYVAHRYHTVFDNYNPDWDWSGIAQEVELVYGLIMDL